MACLVCGSQNTIESHIVPRSIYRILAGDGQHAFEGSLFKEGVKYQAKGLFDRTILCSHHEKMLAAADDYGVKFLRNFATSGLSALRGRVWTVPNPKPEMLVRFVAACIWRRGVSQVERGEADLSLGLAEPKLRNLLFGEPSGYDPPLFLKRRTLLSQGQAMGEVMWMPGKAWGWGDNTWSFFALGCEFLMKLNPYSSRPFPPAFVANRRDQVWCMDMKPEEITDIEGIVEIGANMLRPDFRRRGEID